MHYALRKGLVLSLLLTLAIERMEIIEMHKNVPPDPEQRRRAKVLILAAILLGGFAIRMAYDYTDHLKALAGLDPEVSLAGMQKLSVILLCANALVSSIFAVYFLWLARRVWKEGQFPPRNMKVIRAARISTGIGAKVIALLCLALALLLLSTNIFMWRFHQMLTDLGRHQSAIPLEQPGPVAPHQARFTSGQDRFAVLRWLTRPAPAWVNDFHRPRAHRRGASTAGPGRGLFGNAEADGHRRLDL